MDAGDQRRDRPGPTRGARSDAADTGPEPREAGGTEDEGVGLDELQVRYAADAWEPEQDGTAVAGSDPPRADPPVAEVPGTITAALWDRLAALAGRTLETAKGEAFAVAAIERGAGVTVTLLDGGQRWVVSGEELEAARALAAGGEGIDRLAAIRLQQAGLHARHPEVLAGLLHAVKDG